MAIQTKYFVLMVLPVLAFITILWYGIAWNFYLSTTAFSIYNPRMDFVGLSTYGTLLSDGDFISALRNTLIWAVLLVFGGNLVGLLLACAIFQFESTKVRTALTSYFVYPLAISLVASGVIWRWLFDYFKGFNVYLSRLGFPEIPWLSGWNALFSLVFVSIWVYGGFISLLYLAAFYNVPRDVIDSAIVDGADSLTLMVKVVIPHAKLGLLLGTIFSLLFALQMFDLPYSVLFINPFTMTLVMYMYNRFAYMIVNVSAASCIFLIALSATIVIPYATYGIRKWILKVM
ncbi:MAG: sugar ABC transporter permease [Desulfurococcaceae archaeon]